MKQFKKLMITILLVVFVFTISDLSVISHPAVAQAATVKLSKKSLTLEVGKTATLKISGSKKTVTWSSNKKSVATVSNKGKVTTVTAVAAGKATITATVSGKKYNCTVTVTAPPNPYLAGAPYDAQEIDVVGISLVIPKEWTLNYGDFTTEVISASITPKDTSLSSSIDIGISILETEVEYSDIKKEIAVVYSQEGITKLCTESIGNTAFEITNYSQTDMKTDYGTVLRTEYTLTTVNNSYTQVIYNFSLGSVVVEVAANDFDKLGLSTISDYTIKSLLIK